MTTKTTPHLLISMLYERVFLFLLFHDHYARWSFVIIVIFNIFYKIISFQAIATLALWLDDDVLLRFKTIIHLVTNPLPKYFSPIMKYWLFHLFNTVALYVFINYINIFVFRIHPMQNRWFPELNEGAIFEQNA